MQKLAVSSEEVSRDIQLQFSHLSGIQTYFLISEEIWSMISDLYAVFFVTTLYERHYGFNELHTGSNCYQLTPDDALISAYSVLEPF